MIRLFVALPLPVSVADTLSRLGNGVYGARWVSPENYHLTLRFVGNVDEHVADDVHDALLRIQADAFEVKLKGISWFGTKKKANAIVACAEKSEGLLHLQRKIESACVRVGLVPEERKFMPHVTLARLKGASIESVERYCAERSWLNVPAFPADEFVLYSSFLSQSGAIYTPEADYPLRELVW